MPRQFKFEDKTYSLPDGTSDDEALSFLSEQHPSQPIDLSPRNYGTDNSGEGFFAHATKTLRAIPEAFQSGSWLTGPLDSLSQSMQQYISNPTLHNSIRAIPGIGMLEDTLAQPYRTAQSGDTAGAMGDAVDIGTQMLGLRQAGLRPSEPLQPVRMPGESLSLPDIHPAAKFVINKMPGGRFLTGAYGMAQKSGLSLPGKGTERIYGPPMDLSTSDPGTVLPPGGTFGQGPQAGFGPKPVSRPTIEYGGHVPDYKPPQSAALPPEPAPLAPAGKLGQGMQAGFGPSRTARPIDPVDMNAQLRARPAAAPAARPPAPPPDAPVAPTQPYGFTHPKESLTDLRKQLFATGQEMELPGSPAKTRATEQIRKASMEIYGKSVSQLDYDQLYKLNEFLGRHQRLPVKEDLTLPIH